MTTPARTISLGCRLNAYEADRMADLAAGEQARVIVNTCAVTNEAVRQSRQAVRRARRDNPDAEVVVTGCAATLDPEGFGAMPEVSRLIPNAAKLDPAHWGATTAPTMSPPPVRAPLEVQNGCDHRCTFCIIPFGRGDARSKPPAIAAQDALRLVEAGAKEIVLTGVDLTSYGPDLGEGITLADCVEALLAALPPHVVLRLSSIDGAEVDERLFALITQETRIAPHVHLSLQAGDDMILKRMKRRHTREDALTLCRRLHAARPDIALGADLIAGFPTETDAMFEGTKALIDDAALAYAHIFPFSPRSGTPAARMPQLDKAVIKSRAAELRAAADDAQSRWLSAKQGRRTTVLIEQSTDHDARGKTPDFADVIIPHKADIGDRLPIMITAHTDRQLTGELIMEATPHG